MFIPRKEFTALKQGITSVILSSLLISGFIWSVISVCRTFLEK